MAWLVCVWFFIPNAAQIVFLINADSESALNFAKLTAIFKGVADTLSGLVIVITLIFREYRLVSIFMILTTVFIMTLDLFVWGNFINEIKFTRDFLIHIIFAIPLIVSSIILLKKR